MPMIDFTFPEGALDEAAKPELVERLTAALIELEGAPDNEYVRAITWLFFDERRAAAFAVGGNGITEPVYRVVITVPEGAPGVYGPLTGGNREELVRRITQAVLDAEGTEMSTAAARRVWVHLREIRDGRWAAFGEIGMMTDIAAYAQGGGEEGSKGERFRAVIDAERAVSA